MNQQVNVAIQVLPRAKDIHPYDIVDRAIDVIKESGLKYQVCPFETVIEGDYDVIMKLIEKIHLKCYDSGAEELICNLKIQTSKHAEVTIEDKMKKYH